MYIDQPMPYQQYLVPGYPTITSPQYVEGDSAGSQNGSASPGKLDVQRLSGHARAVSLPSSVVMQTQSSEQQYDIDQRIYGLGLENSE